MEKIILVISLLFSMSCYGQEEQNKTKSEVNIEIDNYIEDLIYWQKIPGLALAVVKDNKILHQKNYGYANLEHQVPITDKSIFRVYSLTKPIIVVGIFQLIEKGKLSLDDKIADYVPNLPKKWKSIQIKHLLSHSAGLPDMSPIPEFKDLTEQEAKEKVFLQDCKFKPGEKYDYNQTGFWLLQKVIEKIENTALSTWIMENQFKTPCDTAFFSSDSRDIVRHRATPYFPFTKNAITIDHSYLQGTYGHAKNGLNISLSEFIKWNKRFHNDQFLNKETKALMWASFPYSKSSKKFTYGWDKHTVDNQISYGFSGSLVTAYRIFPSENLSIIFLSNGFAKFYNIEKIMNDIANITFKK